MTSLYNDPFILHTFLEENIDSNVGNNLIDAFNGFLEHTPPEYINILLNSRYVIDALKNIIIQINSVQIRESTYYIKNTSFTDYNYSGVAHDYYGNTFLSSSTKNDIYLSYDMYISRQYLNKNIIVVPPLEKILYSSIDILIDNIIKDPNPVYFPTGYTTYDTGGHAIGIILDKDNIIICNGGEGIDLHTIQTNVSSEDINKYPQCVIYIKRPNDLLLKNFIRRSIIFNLRYCNTNINNIYQDIIKLYYYQEIYKINAPNAKKIQALYKIIAKNN